MLDLYTHPQWPCAQKVKIVLAEKGLVWRKHHVNLPEKENLLPEYLKLNPLGVVLTLVHNGRPVPESNIICEYLDEAFPQQRLMPSDPYLAAQVRCWMKHVDGKLHQMPTICLPAVATAIPEIAETTSENNLPCPCIREIQPDGV